MSVLKQPKKTATEWDRADIVYALRKRGWTLRSLAQEIGVSYSTINSAIYKPYPKMERAIAAAIGVRADQIWVGRYEKRNFKPTLDHK